MSKLFSALTIAALALGGIACSGGPSLPDVPDPLGVFDSSPSRVADPLPLPSTPNTPPRAPTYNPPPVTAQPTYSPPPATGSDYGYTSPAPSPTYTTPPPAYPSTETYPAPSDPYAYPEPAPTGGSTGSCGSGACGAGGTACG